MAPPVAREQVMTALMELLAGSAAFRSVGRRNRRPETIPPDQTPALMLVEHSEGYRNSSTMQPSVRRLMVRAILYSDVGADENAIPSAVINTILDAFDTVLATSQVTGPCTLGNLVRSVTVEGTVVKAPGDVTGKSIAVVPLTILLP